jgi:hypothetical protein
MKQELPPVQTNSDPPQEAPAEIPTEEPQPAEEAPIEPPRSWSKEEKERFATLPRDTQEYLAQRETERDTALRRGQNEQAERFKTLQARETAAEQARLRYEQALPALMQTLQERAAGEFADVRNNADIRKLAETDPMRFARFQAAQMEMAQVQQEIASTNWRNQQAYSQKWQQFTTAEDQKFAQHAPEMADPTKARALIEDARRILSDAGFSDDDLARNIRGEAAISLRDSRMQQIIRKAVLYDRAQKTAARPAPKAVPPVVRPGVAGARVNQGNLELKALEQKALSTGNARDMAKLLAARRVAAQRG